MQERTTRWLLAEPLDRHNSHAVYKQVSVWLTQFAGTVCSVTADNGSEFARLWELVKSLYFTRPFAPHDKGGVENVIGRVRWDIPKKMNFDRLSKERLAEIVRNINETPRPILNFQSPSQRFCDMLKVSTSACCN
jgi:IS30 family transposase